jgi:hypothetical protein
MAAFAGFFEQDKRVIMSACRLAPERRCVNGGSIGCGLHQITQVHGIAAFNPGAFRDYRGRRWRYHHGRWCR